MTLLNASHTRMILIKINDVTINNIQFKYCAKIGIICMWAGSQRPCITGGRKMYELKSNIISNLI